jgi:hypothetical protein
MTKMEDFKEHFIDPQIDVFNQFQTEFEKSKLFLENERCRNIQFVTEKQFVPK